MEHRSAKSGHLQFDKIERVYGRSTRGNMVAEATAPVALVLDQSHLGFYVGQATSYPVSLLQEEFTYINMPRKSYVPAVALRPPHNTKDGGFPFEANS